jgi:hypothetical protein
MALPHKPLCDVAAHAAEPHDSDLHCLQISRLAMPV